eukprot:SAG31_NODE_9348_length_1291_cov_1.820470_2_plen_132_part_00
MPQFGYILADGSSRAWLGPHAIRVHASEQPPLTIRAGVDAGDITWATGKRQALTGMAASSWLLLDEFAGLDDYTIGFVHNVTGDCCLPITHAQPHVPPQTQSDRRVHSAWRCLSTREWCGESDDSFGLRRC